jgi:hypothetical protein
MIYMPKSQQHYALCAALLFVSMSIPSAYAATKIGDVAAVVGTPSASGADGSRTLEDGSDVFEGDVIKVTTGNAQIILDDGTKLVVGPDSTLVLKQYLKRGNRADKIAIKTLRGTFRFISGKSAKKAYDITTSSATIGIRGTGFDFWDKEKTGVIVMLGAVKMRGNNGKTVSMTDNCDLGVAGENAVAAELLSGKIKSDTIKKNLVFIADQRRLLKAFHLPIRKCRQFILASDGGNGKTVVPQPPQQDND